MKLRNIALLSCVATAFAFPTMADDWFLGGSIGAQKNRFNENLSSPQPTPMATEDFDFRTSETDVFYDVKFGRFFGDSDQHRVYTTYSYNDGRVGDLGDARFNQQNILLSYDYLVPLGQTNISWFIGASAGYSYSKVNASHLGSQHNFVYGGQTGFEYKLNNAASVELGYKYLKQDYKKSTVDDMQMNLTTELNKSEQFYLGLNYRF
ncbi:porin family protein [Shewanella corallii]|uniref:Porin family protein n=1 Tax=Shewanella corallii TaxID=560080 RepID=A0ABT0N851_9GAMM|nr:outer membrane beta-barrel protein [Shewanella corallii]MCL2914616.1 porin family protein [Shewanella corallii]